MRISVSTYIPGTSPVHACDARVKIVLLAAYTVTLFFVDTWLGLVLMLAALAAILATTHIGVRPLAPALAATGVLMVLAVIFNGFAVDVHAASSEAPALGIVSLDAALEGWVAREGAPVAALVGSFGVTGAGLSHGLFYALRILGLVLGSLVVAYTTTSTALTNAFCDFLAPLRRLRVPVDDIAMVLSIAVRFIPVVFEEFGRIRDAQWSRCAPFDEGSLFTRLRTWASVFVPLFVGMFRRADALAQAMDARCYGMPGVRRSSLEDRRFAAQAAAVLAVVLAACIALAVAL